MSSLAKTLRLGHRGAGCMIQFAAAMLAPALLARSRSRRGLSRRSRRRGRVGWRRRAIGRRSRGRRAVGRRCRAISRRSWRRRGVGRRRRGVGRRRCRRVSRRRGRIRRRCRCCGRGGRFAACGLLARAHVEVPTSDRQDDDRYEEKKTSPAHYLSPLHGRCGH